jgi:hypothetical protein
MRKSNRYEEKCCGGNKDEFFTSVRDLFLALDVVCLSVLLHRQLKRLRKLRAHALICERLQNGKCCMLDARSRCAMKNFIIWDMTPGIPLEFNQRFGVTCSVETGDTLLGFFFDREDGGDMCFRNLG